MSEESMDVRPGKRPGYVNSFAGKEMRIPDGWELLPPGDAALSRRIKKDGPGWVVKDVFKKCLISKGILAPGERICVLREELEQERADPAYAKKLEAGRQRRAKQEEAYAEDFAGAVRDFLAFHPRHAAVGEKLSCLIAAHAAPVGSGTVARTRRIPIEQRAEAATIAWLRHQTTSYDSMNIARIKGQRREVRQILAKESRRRLENYRSGGEIDPNHCPIWRVVADQDGSA